MEAVDLPSLAIRLLVLPPFAFRSNEVSRLLLNSNPYGGTDPLGMFPLFLKRTADVMASVLVLCFGVLFVWVVSRLAGGRPMSPQFRKVHLEFFLAEKEAAGQISLRNTDLAGYVRLCSTTLGSGL